MTGEVKHILLIEDNEGDARLVREMLADSGAGFELAVAGTLADSLARAAADPPDAVILDLGLPDCDGLETFTRFHAAAPAVPVIILTTQDDVDALAAISQGAQNFLSKQELTPALLANSVVYSIERAKLVAERQRADAENEITRRRYQAISETVSSYQYERTLAPNGEMILSFVSDGFQQVTGLTLQAGDDVTAFRQKNFHPDDVDRMHDIKARILRGEVAEAEFRIIGADSRAIWLRSIERPVFDAEGRVIGSIGGASDITARKVAEQQLLDYSGRLETVVAERTEELIDLNRQLREKILLQEQAEKSLRRARGILENVFNTTHLQIAYLDRNFNFLRVNEAYAKSAGAPVNFFIGRNHFELYPHAENQAIFQRVVDTGEPYTIFAKPFSFPEHPDWGTTYWDWSLSPIKGADGRVEEITFTLNDVTHTIRTEQALVAEKERLFNVLELMPALIYMMDRNYNLVFANRVFRERFGEALGRKCYSALYRRAEPCEECTSKKLFAGELTSGRFESQTVDGHTYEVFARLIREDGSEDRVLKMAIDITDRKKAEAEKLEAEARLKDQRTRSIHADRLRNLGQMTTSIAHELNQPLVGVRGMAEHIVLAVKRGWRLPDADLQEKAQTIVAQADRMSSIIQHSRMFMRESQSQTLGPVDLNQVVNAALSMVGGQLRAHNFTVTLELAPELPPVQANQYSLEEVILNLVNNARDACLEKEFVGSGPVIIIRTAVWADEGRPKVRAEIEDNGPGIPDEVLPRVFDPFFTTKDVDRGTGLGLAISRSIVENYQGKIAVESRKGEGARFIITLPVSEQ